MKEWGVRGEIKALPLSPRVFSLGRGAEVSLLSSDGVRTVGRVASARQHGRHFKIALEGCLDAVSASRLRGYSICVPRDSVVLEENEYFHDQLIGLSVFSADGVTIGRLSGILETGSNDVYVVKKDDKEYLLPAVRDIIQEIDLGRQRIIIKTMPGLLD